MSHKQITNWCRLHDIWYVKIDIEIPKICIKEAQAVYDEGFFVTHRYGDGGDGGWKSASLHSFVEKGKPIGMGWHHTKNPSGHGLDENDVEWGWTEVAEVCPETVRWLKDFPHKRYQRLRFMLLEPGGSIEDHNDISPKAREEGRFRNIAGAINLAFYQPENCYLRRTDTKEELPFENCTGFWFDNNVQHEALNSSDENRFHFIMHGGFNKEREKLMRQSLAKQFGKDVLKEIDAMSENYFSDEISEEDLDPIFRGNYNGPYLLPRKNI